VAFQPPRGPEKDHPAVSHRIINNRLRDYYYYYYYYFTFCKPTSTKPQAGKLG